MIAALAIPALPVALRAAEEISSGSFDVKGVKIHFLDRD